MMMNVELSAGQIHYLDFKIREGYTIYIMSNDNGHSVVTINHKRYPYTYRVRFIIKYKRGGTDK